MHCALITSFELDEAAHGRKWPHDGGAVCACRLAVVGILFVLHVPIPVGLRWPSVHRCTCSPVFCPSDRFADGVISRHDFRVALKDLDLNRGLDIPKKHKDMLLDVIDMQGMPRSLWPTA